MGGKQHQRSLKGEMNDAEVRRGEGREGEEEVGQHSSSMLSCKGWGLEEFTQSAFLLTESLS